MQTITEVARLRFAEADLDIDVFGEPSCVALVNSLYRRHLRPAAAVAAGRLSIEVEASEFSSVTARTVIERIAREAAEATFGRVAAACALEREGRVLLLAGARRSRKSTLAAHLLTRGWKLLSDDCAIVTPGGTVVVHQPLMSMSALAIPHLPAEFRGALEHSHWSSTGAPGGLTFYEVDPKDAFGERIWSNGGRLEAVIAIEEGHAEGVHSIRASDARGDERFSRLFPLDYSGEDARFGVTSVDRALATAERIDAWYDVHVTP
jgi:hypothetical protein